MRLKTTKVIAALLSAAITVSSLVSAAPVDDVIIAEASQGTTSTADKFSDEIYSMPGPLVVSFPPVDSGENHDSRVTDIVAELWNGLDDGDIAAYDAYSGSVNLNFWPRHTHEDGKESGNYDSFGDLMSITKSLDTACKYMQNSKLYDLTLDARILNMDFGSVYQGTNTVVNMQYDWYRLYNYLKPNKDNEFNLANPLWARCPCRDEFFDGNNVTKISIIKDDYYYWYGSGQSDTYSTSMWMNNYFYNRRNNYVNGDNFIHYFIDLRPEYDYNLSRICSESGGKYIQYTPENLKKLIRLINERRAFDDRVSPTPPPYDPNPDTSTTTNEDPVPGTDKDPIVLIPGIMGSQLYSNEKGKEDLIWPGMGETFTGDLGNSLKITKSLYVKNYDSDGKPINQNDLKKSDRETGPRDTLKALVNDMCNYFPDREVYVFNYDWRKSNRESALKLEEFIDKISADKVDIVAHSMGGLVTSLYIASQGKNKFDKVDKIITVGTPYEGAPHVFEAIEQGKILQDGFKDWLLGKAGISRKIMLGFPGVCELIPSLTYCSQYPMWLRDIGEDENTDHVLDADEYRSTIDDELGDDNSFAAFSLQQAIHSYRPNSYSTSDCNVLLTYDNSYFILGQNKPTVRDVTLHKVASDEYKIVGIDYTSGDGTVPFFSSEMAGLINTYRYDHQYVFPEEHTLLISDYQPIRCIYQILNNEKPDAPHFIEPVSFTEVNIHCPVDVEIGTGDDRLCSAADDLSLTSSFGRMDIIGENDDEKIICMKSGTDFDIKITGTDTGTMDFSVRHYSSDNELLDESYFEDVPITDSTFINTNADNSEETVLCIDKDGDDVVDETWTAQKGETVSAPDETINIIKPIKKNILYGDVDLDGVVSVSDALAIHKYVSNPENYPLNEQALEAADVCDNGTSGINNDDARVIMMIDAELLSRDKLPIRSKDFK